DTVRVAGIIRSFAGNRVNSARINYRVVRQARFPFPWMFAKIGFPRTPAQEIAHGTITADDEGKFFIPFRATPDRSIAREAGPVFEFNIIVDVTDITGETRNAETTVSVGYQSMRVSLGISDEAELNVDSLHKINIRTENLAGVGQPAKVKMVVYSLQG